jgi:hypothetical protein
MIISVNAENAFDKISYYFRIEILYESIRFNIIKDTTKPQPKS